MSTEIEARLTRNVAFMRWLKDRVVQTSSARRRAQFVREFGRALDGHLDAVDDVVLPALHARGLVREIEVPTALHAVLRQRLADALGCDGRYADCIERQLHLLELAPDLLGHGHAQLLKVIRTRLGDDDQRRLVRALAAYLACGAAAH